MQARPIQETEDRRQEKRLRLERGDGVKPRGPQRNALGPEARPPSERERGWGPASTEKSRQQRWKRVTVPPR